jgi:hypothetical protein
MERYRAHMSAVIEDNGDDPSAAFPAWRIVARCQTPVDAQNVVRLLNSTQGAVEALREIDKRLMGTSGASAGSERAVASAKLIASEALNRHGGR